MTDMNFSEPQFFFDNTDLDIESEWNPQYQDSPLVHSTDSTISTPSSPTEGFLYECAFCLSRHSPSAPCSDSHYKFALPESASYSYDTSFHYQEPVDRSNGIIQSNYRKWLVSVTPN